MSGDDAPLHGRVVLLTRPGARGRGLARRLAILGASPVARATIAFEPPADPAAARQAIARLERYAWLVFTSAQGGHAFRSLQRSVGSTGVPTPSVAAVGPGTARSLRGLGLRPQMVGDGSARDFAEDLAHALRPGQRVLVVRPETARDVIPEALEAVGAHVDAIPFYRTVPARGIGTVAEEVARGRFDAAVFSAPSTFQRLLSAGESVPQFRHGLSQVVRVAIGQVTAGALERAGYPPREVARTPDDQGVVEAVLRAFCS